MPIRNFPGVGASLLAKIIAKFASKLAPTILLCCFALPAQAETFEAKVIAVMDGDTLLVLRGKQKIKVRLANIDAPEKDQEYGALSRESLQQLVGQQTVSINSRAVDQYGRLIASVELAGRNINREQVSRGMAWENSNFHSDKVWLGLQKEAQQLRRGLWAQTNPEAPWDWRKKHLPPNTATPKQTADDACAGKRLCSEMVSCDEANLYLKHCGKKSLDGNRDGIPCASLCKGKQ